MMQIKILLQLNCHINKFTDDKFAQVNINDLCNVLIAFQDNFEKQYLYLRKNQAKQSEHKNEIFILLHRSLCSCGLNFVILLIVTRKLILCFFKLYFATETSALTCYDCVSCSMPFNPYAPNVYKVTCPSNAVACAVS